MWTQLMQSRHTNQPAPALWAAVLLVLGVWLWLPAVGHAETPAGVQASCVPGDLFINEIDYDQPGGDTAEFVELSGRPLSDVSRLELHLVGSDGSAYRSIPLTGQTDRAGYYVVAAAGVMGAPHKLLAETNLIRNEARHGVGLYDTLTRGYCNFINYEGTVAGFEAWLNVGEDRAEDGPERSCAISSSGWWSCNRPSTPGGANGFVAVTLAAQAIGRPSIAVSASLLLLLVTTALIISRRRRI